MNHKAPADRCCRRRQGGLACRALNPRDGACRGKHACEITVIESSKIGTIGVGEGTREVFRQMLRHFGMDEQDFLRACGATIKFGIRHRDWRRLGHSYDGPIDDPHLVSGLPAGNALDQSGYRRANRSARGICFSTSSIGAPAPSADREGKAVPLGPFNPAVHFDQALAGQFLRAQAKAVRVIDGQFSVCWPHVVSTRQTEFYLEQLSHLALHRYP